MSGVKEQGFIEINSWYRESIVVMSLESFVFAFEIGSHRVAQAGLE